MNAPEPQSREFQLPLLVMASLPLEALDTAENQPMPVGGVVGDVLQFAADHAGNMSVTTGLALGAVGGYLMARNAKTADSSRDLMTTPEESFRRLRRIGVAVVMGAALLENCVSETRWGLKTFPFVATTLSAPVPDVWDTITSTAWAGVCAGLFWRRRRTPAHKV